MLYINYALYFKENLIKAVVASPYFSLSFDETLNGKLQEVQADCHVAYWNNDGKEVCSRFFACHFFRLLNAQNI